MSLLSLPSLLSLMSLMSQLSQLSLLSILLHRYEGRYSNGKFSKRSLDRQSYWLTYRQTTKLFSCLGQLKIMANFYKVLRKSWGSPYKARRNILKNPENVLRNFLESPENVLIITFCTCGIFCMFWMFCMFCMFCT